MSPEDFHSSLMESREKSQRWGWYSTLFEIADSGVFNRLGLSPIQSAITANALEALMYLARARDFGQ